MHDQKLQRFAMAGLLERAGHGDAGAFSELYRLSAPRLMPYALRYVKTRMLAEDVLQESFLSIWRNAASFDNTRSAPFTWMTTIVCNKAVDCLRDNHMYLKLTDSEVEYRSESQDSGKGPCEMVADAQQGIHIKNVLKKLDIRSQRAIELAFFQDLSYGEVAVEMAAPLGTVKTWIRRACIKLRPYVEQPLALTSPGMQPVIACIGRIK